MSLRTWQRISILVMLLLLASLGGYTWLVFSKVPSDVWSWGHQLVAACFSVMFAGALAVGLYTWQTEKANDARKTELRNAQLISVFDIWDHLRDTRLSDIKLPDGSVEKVSLTFLQPTIFEESIRSGLFSAREMALLSRLAAAIHVYNDSVVGFLPLARTFTSKDKEHVDTKRLEMLRNTIYAIRTNRVAVAEVSKNLLSLWSFDVAGAAIDAAQRGQEATDPRVAQWIAQIQERNFGISPGGYKGALYKKLEQAKEATAKDREPACTSLDDIIKEAQNLSDKKITPEEAEQLISEAKVAKKKRGCS